MKGIRALADRWGRANRFVRFLLVGGLNTAFGYGAYAGFLWMGLHYSIAAALGTVAGVLFNFQSTGRLVFGSRDQSRLIRFVAVYGVAYLVNVAGLAVLVGAGLSPYLAGFLLILPLALLSFWMNRRFVFRAP